MFWSDWPLIVPIPFYSVALYINYITGNNNT